jgi:DNA/RNA endonuclease YhcR with UshA esterase domain
MKKAMFILISLSLISCSTTKSGTAKTMDIVGSGVIHKPVIVDLDVKQEKASKTVVLTNVLSLDNAKNEAVRELLKEKSADILVEPTFDSKTKNGKTELTVYGWTANYKNFRQVEEKDIKLLEISPSLRKAETYQPVVEKKKGKGLGWAIGGAAILVGAIIATSGSN